MPATDKTGHGSMSRENHSIRDEPNLERRSECSYWYPETSIDR